MNAVINPVYQTAVKELEAVLSPRIVSRALKEGLRQSGRTPESAEYADLEKVLKGQVYRQLQAMMPVSHAKQAVERILERMADSAAASQGSPGEAQGGIAAQAKRLGALQEELRPFNLYFEWSEVQKLRAQVQLIEADQEAGREVPGLLADAEAQLSLVKQKLEDQLVLQARDVGEIQGILEELRGHPGPRLRRLESLVNQLNAAQAGRQLVAAEVERARRIARELTRTLEAAAPAAQEEPQDVGPAVAPPPAPPSVPDGDQGLMATLQATEPGEAVTPGGADPVTAAAAAAPPEDAAYEPADATALGAAAVTPEDGPDAAALEEREPAPVEEPEVTFATQPELSGVDLEAELHELRSLEGDFASVVDYLPELATHLNELRAELEAERSVAEVLAGMREALEGSSRALRDDLLEEFEDLVLRLPQFPPEVDTTELEQAARVTVGILASALPSRADVEHVRRLHQLAKEQKEVVEREEEQRQADLAKQAGLLERLEATLLSREQDDDVQDEVARLRSEFDQLRLAQTQNIVAHDLVSAAREAEEALAQSLATRATAASERRLARLSALRAKLERLPVTLTYSDRTAELRLELQRLIKEQENAAAAAGLLLDDVTELPVVEEVELDSLGTEIEALRGELTASIRQRLARIAEEAAGFGSQPLVERVERALEELAQDRYPDLGQLQGALRHEKEAYRQEQVDELRLLSQAAQPFETGERGQELAGLLATARDHLEAGQLAPGLEQAARLLDALERQADEKLAGLPRRLDAALGALEEVSKLNSEGVTTVRRILRHLDSQREALPRLSRGLQLELEASLTRAESLLEELRGDFEAAQQVALKVVSGGLLDDVLGILGPPGDAPQVAQGAPARRAELLAGYLSDGAVTGGGWTDAAGNLLAGEDGVAPPAATELIANAAAGLAGAGAACVLAEHEALVVAWTADGERVTLRVSDPRQAGALAELLRQDLARFPV